MKRVPRRSAAAAVAADAVVGTAADAAAMVVAAVADAVAVVADAAVIVAEIAATAVTAGNQAFGPEYAAPCRSGARHSSQEVQSGSSAPNWIRAASHLRSAGPSNPVVERQRRDGCAIGMI